MSKPHVSIRQSITYGGEPGELKHLSTPRRRKKTMEGRIGYKESGENGFGYDPIFYLPEYGCTSAEISMEEKNKISHRGKALRAIKDELR